MSLINYTGIKSYAISAKDLQKKNNTKDKTRISVFETILEKCYNKIRVSNEFNNEYCFFEFKDIAWGVSLYNIDKCLLYVSVELIKNGYKLEKIRRNMIFIDWRKITPIKQKAAPKAIIKNKGVSFGKNSIYTFDSV
jgi:hypothetical protein